MNQLSKSRVVVDFFAHERDALQLLCEQDIRPPAEQIRWLVIQAAQERKSAQAPEEKRQHEPVPA